MRKLDEKENDTRTMCIFIKYSTYYWMENGMRKQTIPGQYVYFSSNRAFIG
jgi:hypothetical protein